jgi:hypothetical protein
MGTPPLPLVTRLVSLLPTGTGTYSNPFKVLLLLQLAVLGESSSIRTYHHTVQFHPLFHWKTFIHPPGPCRIEFQCLSKGRCTLNFDIVVGKFESLELRAGIHQRRGDLFGVLIAEVIIS